MCACVCVLKKRRENDQKRGNYTLLLFISNNSTVKEYTGPSLEMLRPSAKPIRPPLFCLFQINMYKRFKNLIIRYPYNIYNENNDFILIYLLNTNIALNTNFLLLPSITICFLKNRVSKYCT